MPVQCIAGIKIKWLCYANLFTIYTIKERLTIKAMILGNA